MNSARVLGTVLTVAVAALLLTPGLSPIRLSYVTSDSMEPAIMEGDGYVIRHTPDVDVGDVITFRSPERGGFVTHRVVDESPEGLITKGDNNPSRDQAAGMPPVPRDAVVGEVVALGDDPLTIPAIGTATRWLDEHRLGALLVLGLLALAALLGSGDGAVARDVVYVADIALPLFLGVVVVSAGLMLYGTTFEDLQYVATQGGSPAPHTVAVDEPMTQRVDIDMFATPLTTTVIDADGVEMINASGSGSEQTIWVKVPAIESTGAYTATVSVHPYPAVVPRHWLERLHGLHPVAAMATAITAVFGPIVALYALFMDGRARLRAPRSRRLRRLMEGGR